MVQEAVEQAAETVRSAGEEDVTIYLVRHGKTFLTPQDRYRDGRIHLLQRKGESQADAAGKGMKDIVFTTAFSAI